jgi:hypothetical protein
MAYLLLFNYPIHSFKGWSLSRSSDTFRQLGPVIFVLKTLVFNVFLAIAVPQAAFIYFLLYYLLPKFFFRKRNPLVTACVLISVLLVYYPVAIHFKFMAAIGNYLSGASTTLPPYLPDVGLKIYMLNRELLTSFPIVTGFALMIRLMKSWWLKQKEIEQLASEKAKAELQLLKAQVHPHFLFNTLNNIYFFTLSGSHKAPEMIKSFRGCCIIS